MKNTIAICAFAFAFVPGLPTYGAEGPPEWAYPVNPPDFKPPEEDGVPRRVPGIIKVVEADTAPKTFITFNHLAALPSGEKEPIGQRIVEVPEVLEHFANRDTQTQFIAYVPPAASKKAKHW